MKDFLVLIIEIAVTVFLTAFGMSGRKILFLQGERTAVILLGIIGMLLCTLSVGRFISTAPVHPLTILGYIFGVVAMLTFFTQLFKWKLPLIENPKIALEVMAAAIIANSIISKFYFLLKR